jgi:DDE family transposase
LIFGVRFIYNNQHVMLTLMGLSCRTRESREGVFRLDFDRRLTLQFRGSAVTSDAGLLAYRELDDAFGLSAMAGETLSDSRTGKNGRHALVGKLRQAVFQAQLGLHHRLIPKATGVAMDQAREYRPPRRGGRRAASCGSRHGSPSAAFLSVPPFFR